MDVSPTQIRTKTKKFNAVYNQYESEESIVLDKIQNLKSQELNFSQKQFKQEAYQQYYNTIKTTINCSKDLRMYKHDYAVSNQFIGVIGIRILDSLKETFNGCEYVLRGYHEEIKIFEAYLTEKPLFIDLFQTNIAYIYPSDPYCVKVIDIGGYYGEGQERFYIGLPEKAERHEYPMVKPVEFRLTEQSIQEIQDFEIKQFKLGHYLQTQGALPIKAIFVTEKAIVFLPLNVRIETDEFDTDYLRPYILTLKQFQQDEEMVEKILSIGVKEGESAGDQSELWEVVIVQDSKQNLHLYKLENRGRDIENLEISIYGQELKNKYGKPIQVIDAMMISVYKCIGLIKVIDPQSNDSEISTFKFIIWTFKNLNNNDDYEEKEIILLKVEQTFNATPIQYEEKFKFWKKNISIDDYNNRVFVPIFRESENMPNQRAILLQLDNANSTYNILEANKQMIKDSIGAHSSQRTNNNLNILGLMFSDFIIYQDTLIMSHGSIVTVVDISDINNLNPCHLRYEKKNLSDTYVFEFENEVSTLLNFDKDAEQYNLRNRFLVIYKNGGIQEIKKTEIITKGFQRFEPKDFYCLQPFLEDQNHIEHEIVKIFTQQNSEIIVPFILTRYGKALHLMTLTFENKKLKFLGRIDDIVEAQDGCTQEIYVVFLNKYSYLTQDAIIFVQFSKGTEIKSIYQFSILLQKELSQDFPSIVNSHSHFVKDDLIYFIAENKIVQYNYLNEEVYQISRNSKQSKKFIRDLKVIDDNFFYWKSITTGAIKGVQYLNFSFDKVNNLDEFDKKVHMKDLNVIYCVKTKQDKFYYDRVGQQIGTFINLAKIEIFPFLHTSTIVIPKGGMKTKDVQVLGTILKGNFLYTFHNNNTFYSWDIRTVHQNIHNKYVMLRSIKIEDDVAEIEDIEDNQMEEEEVEPLISINDSELDRQKFKMKFEKEKTTLQYLYGIDDNNKESVKIAEYKVIELVFEDGQNLIQNIQQKGQRLNNLSVKEIFNFKGPCYVNQNNNFLQTELPGENYGLVMSDELDLLLFYFKDFQDQIKMLHYELFQSTKEINNQFVLKVIKCHQQTSFISVFSPNLKYLLAEEENSLKIKHFMSKENTQELVNMNLKFRDILDNTESEPSFITNDILLFRSEEDIIMGYQIFEESNLNCRDKELFMIAETQLPDNEKKAALDMIFKSGDHYIGNKHLIYERREENNKIIENIAPNHFGDLLDIYLDSSYDVDNIYELKYIQTHYKTMVQLCKNSYDGYIFYNLNQNSDEKRQSIIKLVKTFTYYDWRLMQLIENDIINISTLDINQLIQLCHTQLPNGDTILHKLAYVDSKIYSLFDIANENQILLPFLKDRKGMNPIQMLITTAQQYEQDKDTLSRQKHRMMKQLVQYMLKQIETYPFDLYKINFESTYQILFDEYFTQFISYIESRAQQPSFLATIDSCQMSENLTIFSTNEIWSLNQDIIRKNLQSRAHSHKSVEIKVLNFPDFHLDYKKLKNVRRNKEQSFLQYVYQQLEKKSNQQVFELDSVKALIEVRWDQVKRGILYFQLIPYVAFTIFFSIYTIWDFESFYYIYNGGNTRVAFAFRVLTFITVAYKMLYDIVSFGFNKLQFLKGVWNLLGIFEVLLTIIAEIIATTARNLCCENLTQDQINLGFDRDRLVRLLYSFVALSVWIHMLYFFRIFRSTGYYIKMIMEVILDIRYFIFIFFVVIIAFGHAYNVFFYNGIKEKGQLSVQPKFFNSLSYSYLIPLGDYNQDIFPEYQFWVPWLFFVLASLINLIVLMNLLISIVSDTFSRIKEQYSIVMYQDMLHLIMENKMMFKLSRKVMSKYEKRYLIIAIPSEKQVKQEDVQGQLADIQNQLKELKKLLKEK